LDVDMRSSRQHAIIQKSGDAFELHALRTTNGTFINGQELPTGQACRLSNRDIIQFGFRGVKLIFRLPGKKI